MKFEQLFESETEVVYRGLEQEFNINEHNNSNVIFVTPSIELATAYSDSPDHVYKFEVVLGRGFNFGFRTLSTEVKWDDIQSRLQRGIMSAYTDKQIDKETAMQLYDVLDTGGNKTKMVAAWKWYMSVPLICDVLRKAGYDHIVGYEGSNNNIIAYGVLYPENLKRLNP